MINPGVVAAIRLVCVCCDPCGAILWTTVQRIARQGSPRTPTTRIAATTPGLIIRILNSVLLKFLNCSVTLTTYRPTP